MNERRVLVTGGTRGLGLAICRNLKDGGYSVIAAARKATPEILELAAAPGGPGAGTVRFEELDLSDHKGIRPAITGIVKRHGALYGLVNNAALAHDGVLATMHDSQVEDVISVNVTGTLLATKYAVRSMLVEGSGRVVNVASIIASSGFNGLSVYGASKAALIGFTKSLARELGKAGVTVNAVSPGYMKTDMSAGLDENQLASITRRSPMGKLVEVEDVAWTVRYLLSDQAAAITGANFTVDAGSTC